MVCQRCAGIDVSKRDAKVCVRVQGRGSTRTTARVSTWSSVMPQIVKLREQLVADQVELVVLESTSDYWRPFFYVLSEAVPVMLVKASDVKGMPGRKTDVSDAEWLADLAAHGLVRASFVPEEPQRQLRDLTRARVGLFQERTRELQRLEKLLELSRSGARCPDCSGSVSPDRSPNPPCVSRRNGLSTETAVYLGCSAHGVAMFARYRYRVTGTASRANKVFPSADKGCHRPSGR